MTLSVNKESKMDKHEEFLSHIPVTGQSIGNIKLNSILQWDSDTYNGVKRELLERGDIQLGRGQGGSVRLATPSKEKDIDTSQTEGEAVSTEPESTEPTVSVLPDYSDVSVEEDGAEFIEEIVLEDIVEEIQVENSSLDPVVIACPGEVVAASVIEVLKEKYTRTQFYTVVAGADTLVRIRLRNFGNLKTVLSHEILTIAQNIATDALEKILGPVEEEQPVTEEPVP
jgi:hypothetical protein